MKNLKDRAISGIFWSSVEAIGDRAIHFIISIILARILMPEEFGLVAMLSIFMLVAESLINSGFGQALIQNQNVDHKDESTVFFFNLLIGGMFTALLILSAPIIADFFRKPILVPLARLLSLNLLITAFAIVQRSLIIKQMKFKTLFKATVTAKIISGIGSIVLALKGWGVWTLLLYSLSNNLIRTILLWKLSNWNPGWHFRYLSLRKLFPFGSKLVAFGLLDRFFKDIYFVVIGKFFSAADLGFFSRARTLSAMPTITLSTIINRVMFPAFSEIQDEKHVLKRGIRKVMTLQAMVNFPLMIGLILIAKPLVIVILTEKWLPCVVFFQLFCIINIFRPLLRSHQILLQAKGLSGILLYIDIAAKILIVANITITYRFGILYMLVGQFIITFLTYIVRSYYTSNLIEYSILEQIKDLIPYISLSIIMGCLMLIIRPDYIKSPELFLIVSIFSGLFIYCTLCRLLRLKAFMELLDFIRPKLTLKKNYGRQ